MADTPSSGSGGTNIESLQLDFKTNGDEAMVSALDKIGTATVTSVRNLDGLNKAVETNQEFMARSAAGYQNQIQIMQAKWREEQRAIKSAEDLIKINEVIVEQGSAYIAKLSEMVATYNMTTAALQTYKAEQLQVAAQAAPLIAAMEEMRIATERYGVSITQVEQIEGARLVWEEANMTALNAQRRRALAEQAQLEESSQTSLNAQRIRMTRENEIAEVESARNTARERLAILEQEAAAETALNAQRIRNITANAEAEASARTALNAQRIREMTEQAAAEESSMISLNAQRIRAIGDAEKEAVALAEKQAIEEIRWNELSVKARITELERLKAYQAAGSVISPGTIASTFSSTAISDLQNLAKYQTEYAAALSTSATAHGAVAKEAKGAAAETENMMRWTARSTNEVVVLGRELGRGNYSRMAGSFSVLASSIGLTINPLILLTLATAAFFYEVAKGSMEQDKMNQALITTGNYSGQTSASMMQLSRSATEAGGTIGTAKDAVTALAASGKFTSEQIGTVATAVTAMENATGKSIENTIKEFESLAVQTRGNSLQATLAISNATLKLDDTYHFLTTSIYEQVQALERDGDMKAASKLATDTYAESVRLRSEEMVSNLGTVGNAWRAIKDHISEVLDMMQKVGKKTTLQDTVDGLNQKVQAIVTDPMADQPGLSPNAKALRIKQDAELKNLLDQLRYAQQLLNEENDRAAAAGEKAIAQSKANHAASYLEVEDAKHKKDSLTQLQRALQANLDEEARLRVTNPDSQKLTEEAIYNRKIDTIKEYSTKARAAKNDGRKIELADELADIDYEYKISKDASDDNVKLLLKAGDAKRITREDEYALIAMETKDQLAALDRMEEAKIAVLAKYQPQNDNDAKAAIKRMNDVERAYDLAAQKIKEAGNAAQTTVVDKAVKEDGRDDSAEIKKLTKQIEAQKLFNAEIGKTAAEKELAKKQVQDEINSQDELLLILLQIQAATENLGPVETAVNTQKIKDLKEVIELRKQDSSLLQTGSELAAAHAIQKQIDADYKTFNKKLEDDLASAIVDGGGRGVQKLIRDMEMSFAKTILRPILQPITDGIAGMLYPGATQAGGVAGAAGSGGVGGTIGLANAAVNAYKMVSNGLSSFSNMGTYIADTTQGMMYQAGLTNQIASNGSFATAAGSIGSTVGGYMAGSALNTAISGQYQTGSGIQTAEKIATAVASYINPVAGAVVGAISGLINRAFGMGNKNVTSTGMSGTLSSSGLTSAQNYSTWHQDGGWFRSDKNGTDTSAVDPSVVNSFTAGFAQMKAASNDFGKSVGITSTTLDSYSKTFNIALTSDAAANQKAITDFFVTVGDEMALRLVPNINQFARSGETASVTLQRLSDEFKATDSLAMSLGRSAASMFKGTGLDTAMARDRVITAMGGTSNASSLATTYAQNFLTESQKLAPALAAVNSAMSALGYSGVDTREKFASLVNSLIDSGAIMTDAGAKQFADLMNLSSAFATTHAASVDLTKSVQQIADEFKSLQDQYDQLTMTTAELRAKERLGISDENKALYDQVKTRDDLSNAYKTESAALKQTIADNKAFAASLLTFKDSLNMGSLSGFTPVQALAEAKQQYESMLAKAKTGDKDAQSNITNAAQAYLTADQLVKASSGDYMNDKNSVLNDMQKLADSITGGQTDAELQLAAMDKSVSQLIDINEGVKSVAQLLSDISKLPVPNSGTNAPLPSSTPNGTVMPPPVSGFVTVIAPLVEQIQSLQDALVIQTNAMIVSNAVVTNDSANVVAQGSVSAVKYSNWKLAQLQESWIDK